MRHRLLNLKTHLMLGATLDWRGAGCDFKSLHSLQHLMRHYICFWKSMKHISRCLHMGWTGLWYLCSNNGVWYIDNVSWSSQSKHKYRLQMWPQAPDCQRCVSISVVAQKPKQRGYSRNGCVQHALAATHLIMYQQQPGPVSCSTSGRKCTFSSKCTASCCMLRYPVTQIEDSWTPTILIPATAQSQAGKSVNYSIFIATKSKSTTAQSINAHLGIFQCARDCWLPKCISYSTSF